MVMWFVGVVTNKFRICVVCNQVISDFIFILNKKFVFSCCFRDLIAEKLEW